ncbi:MAG: tetratricopeptide repeat protein [Gemmatimonadales bacterium]
MRELTNQQTASVEPISLLIVAAVVALGIVLLGCEPVPEVENEPDRFVEPIAGPVTSTPATFVQAPEIPSTAPPVERGPVTFEEAEGVYHERRYVEAAELFASYVEEKPKNAWGYYMLGLSAWKAGDLERAESAFKTGLSLDPKHVRGFINLSRVLLQDGRPQEAREQLDAALELDRTSSTVYRLIGRVHADLGDVDEAHQAYRRSIEINNDDVWSLNNLGVLLIGEQRSDEALGPLSRAVITKPGIAIFHNNLGMALERTGYFVGAVEQYRLAIEADPTHGKAESNLGRIEGRQDRPGLPPLDLDVLSEEFIISIIVVPEHDEVVRDTKIEVKVDSVLEQLFDTTFQVTPDTVVVPDTTCCR